MLKVSWRLNRSKRKIVFSQLLSLKLIRERTSTRIDFLFPNPKNHPIKMCNEIFLFIPEFISPEFNSASFLANPRYCFHTKIDIPTLDCTNVVNASRLC